MTITKKDFCGLCNIARDLNEKEENELWNELNKIIDRIEQDKTEKEIKKLKNVYNAIKTYYKDLNSLCQRLKGDEGFVIYEQDANALAMILDIFDGLEIEL